MNRTFYIEHLGCAKNRVDAQRMINSLEDDSWSETTNPDEAEVIIVNTCGFIEPAKKESIDVTLALRKAYPGKRLILAGCLAERYGEDLTGTMPEVDEIFGNRDPENITTIIHKVTDDAGSGDLQTSGSTLPESSNRHTSHPSLRAYSAFTIVDGKAGYLKISEGCANRCSFCAIPIIRGSLRSRATKDIVSDARVMLESGVREINLIAQDIASYGTEKEYSGSNGTSDMLQDGITPFIDLLSEILELPGDFWLRMLYIHPDHFPSTLLDLVAREKRLLPYFDLPFQHASTDILRAMGRRGTHDSYLELISTIRQTLPDSVIRSTFLLGFPGETDADREALLRFQEEAQIDWLGVFEYSREEGTSAYSLGNPSRSLRRKAAHIRGEIESRQTRICESRMERFVGRRMDVLVEEPMTDVDLAIGRGYIHAPEVDANVVIHGEDFVEGERYRCRIIKRNGIDLEAVVEDTR